MHALLLFALCLNHLCIVFSSFVQRLNDQWTQSDMQSIKPKERKNQISFNATDSCMPVVAMNVHLLNVFFCCVVLVMNVVWNLISLVLLLYLTMRLCSIRYRLIYGQWILDQYICHGIFDSNFYFWCGIKAVIYVCIHVFKCFCWILCLLCKCKHTYYIRYTYSKKKNIHFKN